MHYQAIDQEYQDQHDIEEGRKNIIKTLSLQTDYKKTMYENEVQANQVESEQSLKQEFEKALKEAQAN